MTSKTENDINFHTLSNLFDYMIKWHVKNPDNYEIKFGILRTVMDGRQVRIFLLLVILYDTYRVILSDAPLRQQFSRET